LASLIGDELPSSAQCVNSEDVRRSSLHYYHPARWGRPPTPRPWSMS
jgi:hypothetical protein